MLNLQTFKNEIENTDDNIRVDIVEADGYEIEFPKIRLIDKTTKMIGELEQWSLVEMLSDHGSDVVQHIIDWFYNS
jgi:hypothetical protein